MATHRTAFTALALTVLTLGLNVLLLRAPAPTPGTERDHCVKVTPLGGGFRHIENCDSSVFLALAREPSSVLTPDHRLWQSRPLYPALGYVLARPFEWARRLSPQAPEYVAFLLVNLAAVALAATLFHLLWRPEPVGASPAAAFQGRIAPELFLPLVMLMANDLTKAFFWTPHLQMLNILMPCLTLYLTARLLGRGRPLGMLEGLVLGLALGVGLLLYGAFVVTAGTLALALLVRYRQVLAPCLLLAGFAVPFLCWVAFVRLETGDFYSHEVVAYRQFVWMLDCAQAGAGPCLAIVRHHGQRFLEATRSVMAAPLALLAAIALGRRLFARHWSAVPLGEPAHHDHPALKGAVVAYLAVAIPFLAGMGYYAPRLSWTLVPAVLVLITIELGNWRETSTRSDAGSPRPCRLGGLALIACAVYVMVLLLEQGPYS